MNGECQRVSLASRRETHGYLEKGVQTPMAQGRSTRIILMIKWVRVSRLSTKKSLSVIGRTAGTWTHVHGLASTVITKGKVTERKSVLSLRRRTVNFRRQERARNEGNAKDLTIHDVKPITKGVIGRTAGTWTHVHGPASTVIKTRRVTERES